MGICDDTGEYMGNTTKTNDPRIWANQPDAIQLANIQVVTSYFVCVT